MFFRQHPRFQTQCLQAHVFFSSDTRFADIMSVFGKIATGSLAGMAAGLHIRVDPQAAQISLNSLKNRPFSGRNGLIDDA
jgi:hypothetical protein